MFSTIIIRNIIMAQCVRPGVLTGLKLRLNSEDKFLLILLKTNCVTYDQERELLMSYFVKKIFRPDKFIEIRHLMHIWKRNFYENKPKFYSANPFVRLLSWVFKVLNRYFQIDRYCRRGQTEQRRSQINSSYESLNSGQF